MGDEIKVEQCDREAAASVAVLVEMRELILAGRADHHAEPFARHRIQHGAQSEWQPIDTAPKDGTFVQLFEPCAHPPVSVGCYDDEAGWLIGEADFMPSKCQPRYWAPLLPRPDIEPDAKSESTGVSDMEAQLAEAQREIERLRKALEPQWFYIDGWEENCLFSIYDAIDLAGFEPGYHLLEVSTATPRPTIWCAVHVTDDDDVDARFTFTEHASEAEARAALEAKP